MSKICIWRVAKYPRMALAKMAHRPAWRERRRGVSVASIELRALQNISRNALTTERLGGIESVIASAGGRGRYRNCRRKLSMACARRGRPSCRCNAGGLLCRRRGAVARYSASEKYAMAAWPAATSSAILSAAKWRNKRSALYNWRRRLVILKTQRPHGSNCEIA